MIESIIIALVALVLGCAGGYALFRYVVKGKYKEMVDAGNHRRRYGKRSETIAEANPRRKQMYNATE